MEAQERLLQQQADELERQGKVATRSAERDTQRADYLSWVQPYLALTRNADFAEKSEYQTEQTGKDGGWLASLATKKASDLSKWKNPLYEAINGNEEAGLALYGKDQATGRTMDPESRRIAQMTAQEKQIYNYLYKTNGIIQANKYFSELAPELNARASEAEKQSYRDLVHSGAMGAIAGNLLSVGMNVVKPGAYILQLADAIGKGEVDPNAGYNRLSYIPSTIRAETGAKINKTLGDTWGKVGEFGYQTFMSIADFLTTTAVSGGFGASTGAAEEWLNLGIMGTGAAADAVIAARERGVDTAGAMVIGTVAGAAEMITEKVSLETLIDPDLLADGKLKYILKNVLAEGSEEGASDLINFTADALYETLTHSGKSELETSIRELMEQGHTRPEAIGIALGRKAEELGLSVLGGALSGGVMAGGNVALGDIQQAGMDRDVGRVYQDPDTARALVQEGLDSAPDSEARRIAERNLGRLDAGKALSARRLGQQVRANDAAIEGGKLKPLTLPSLEETATEQEMAAYSNQTGENENAAPEGAAESTAVDDDPAQHTPAEQRVIEEYKKSADESLAAFVEKVRGIQNQNYKNGIRHDIITQTDNAARKAEELTGINTAGYRSIINGSSVQHIDKRHGINGSADHSMSDIRDFSRIGFVLDNFTDAKLIQAKSVDPETAKVAYAWMNSENTPAPLVQYSMPVNGVYYVVEAVPSSKAHVMAVVSAYISGENNKRQQPQSSAIAAEESTASVTPEAPLDRIGAATNNIAQQQPFVKGKPESFSDIVMKQLTGESGTKNQTGGIIHAGEEAVAGTQPAQAGGTGQNALGAQGPLYGGDAGRRAYDHGTAGAGAVRGGSRENRALTAQRQQAAADQPLVSPADMGIENGSQEATLRILPEDSYDQEARAFTEWAYGKGIRDVKIVVGLIQIQTEHGEQSVLDVINKQTGTLIIRGDSLKRSLTETGRHAIGHFVTGRQQVEAFAQTVKSRYKEAAWGQMFDVYKDKWSVLTGDYAGMTAQEAALYVWEEILEDAYANAYGYGTKASLYHQEALEAIDGTGVAETDYARGETQDEYRLEQGTSGSRGPPERYSLRDVPVPTYAELIEKPDVPVVDIRRTRSGSFAQEREAFLNSERARRLYAVPVVNRDTGESMFITPHTIKHTFSNLGWEQIELAEHLPELIENAVLTHAEPSRNATGDHTTGVYSMFGAAMTDAGVQPVKLTVKEYNIDGQDIPATIQKYLGTGIQPETFAGVYDGKVLVLEGIEKEGPSSSATTDTTQGAAVNYPSGPSELSVKDLLALVKGDAARYVPQVDKKGSKGIFSNERNVRYSVDGKEQEASLLQRSDVVLGEEDQTFTETDRPVDFTWAVVPADSLIVSNDQHGNKNPAYPADLQPRDRSRAASQAQIQKMSRGLIPRKLAESPTAQNGAPIIRADGVVIGGNARSAAIVAAYEAGMAEDYEKFIRDRGGRYCIDTTALPDKPVLVRVAKGADNWAALAQDLNVSSTAAYSTTETAMADAKRMDGILDLLQPNDAGDINTAENSDFIQAFLSGVVSASERSGLVTGNGLLSQAGLERAKNAIFAYAYGNPDLMARYSESLDNDMKNVTNALMQSAPAAVALRTAIEQGAAYDVPAVQTVLKGLELYGESKRTGKTVAEQVAQMDLLDEDNWSAAFIAEFIEANKRSAKQLRTLFNSLYDAVEAYGDPKQESLFGGEEHDIREALDGALSAYERETGHQIERPDYWRDGGYTGMDAGFGAANPGESDTHDAVPDASGQDDAGENGEGIQKALRPLSLPTLEETRTETKAQEDLRPVQLPALEETRTEPPAQEDFRPVQLPTLEPPKRERKPPRPKPQPHKPLQNRPYPEGYNSVEEYQASIEARAAAAREERLRNVSKENFTGTPALATLGVKIENSVGIYSDIDRLIAADRAAKQIQKATRRAEQKLGATEKERNFASGIAAGIYTEGEIPASMDSEKVMELADYYAAEKAVATDRIRQQRTEIGRVLNEKMEDLFRDSDDFKPSRAIILNYRTPERNILHIFGDKRGKEINAAIFGPVAVNEAERIRFINRMHNEVRTFQDKNGRQSKLTKPERDIVQQVIEGKAAAEMVAGVEMRTAIENAAHNIRNGADAGDAAREFGLSAEQRKLAIQYARWLETEEVLRSGKVDTVKVKSAADKYSEMFNKFYAAINDFLVAHGYEPIGFIKGYAPHIQPEQQQNLLNKAFRALGINTDVTRLPSDIAGLTGTYRPNKRWNPYFLQRTGDVTQYDIASAYESYLDYMSDVIYHTDDIMRVRAATRYFRQTYAPEEIKNNLSWASELRYGSTEGKANFLRDQGVIDKATAMTPADVDAQMEAYVEKMFGDIKKTTKYSDLVVWLDNYANILAGKQSMADRSPESMFGREVLNVGNRLIRTFAQANVAGNLSSVLNQSAQIPMIQAELGTRWTAAAIKDIITGRIRRGEWAGQSDFLTGKHGIEYLVSTPGEMVISALFKPAELMDTFVSTVAVRGRYLKEIHAKKIHTEAMRTADAFGTAIMGSRMKGSKPLAFHSKNPIYQMVNIFQIEAFNSWEHVKEDLPRDFRTIEQTKGKGKAALALAGVIVKGLLLAFLMNRLAEKVYGGTPAPFDLLGLTANFVASGEGLTTNAYMRTLIDNAWEKISGERLFGTSKGKEKPFDWEQALEDLGYNVTNDIPFLRNAAGLLGIGDETLPMPDLYGNGKDLVESLKKNGLSYDSAKSVLALLAQLLPGGRQLYKTAMGTETVVRGGDFSGTGENEKLKYPTDDDFWSTVQAMLMGKYATEASDAYYAAGDTALSAKQTRLWRSLTEGGADKRGVYDAIKKFREIQNTEDLDSYEKGVRERDLIAGLDMTDDQKLEMYRELTSAESKADKFQAIMDTGLSFGQVMGIYDKYAELDETDQKGIEKATAFAEWVDQQGYKAAQEAVIKDQLRYWNIIPADADRYEKLTDAGLESRDAGTLTRALAALQPEDGDENVSKMQQYREIAKAKLSDQDKLAAIGTIMGSAMTTEDGNPSAYAKLNTLLDAGITLDQYLDLHEAGAVDGYMRYTSVSAGRNYGITPDVYIDFRARLPRYDADHNGSFTQKEVQAALDSMGGGGRSLPSLDGEPPKTLTNTQKAVLWQLYSKSWKPWNNPFDRTIGQWVYDALNAKTEDQQSRRLPSLD